MDAPERILTACQRVIARAGLRGFRMQDVAREANVSIGLLAYHFGDRDGLLQAALDHVNAGAARRAGEDAAPTHSRDDTRPAADRLAALLCSEFGEEDGIREGSIAWNELRAAAVFAPAQAAALTRSTGEWQERVRILLDEAGDHAPEATALTLSALVEGLSGRWLTGQLTAAEAQDAVRRTLSALRVTRVHGLPDS